MRDIYAELEQWNYDATTRWEPSTGDILIGVVKGCSPCGIGNTLESIIVQEEDTELLVAVMLESPDLNKLVKLQRPRINERIGIKCTSSQLEGGQHFVLMVDRSAPYQEIKCVQEEVCYDECEDVVGATDEERCFIEQALLQDDCNFDAKSASVLNIDSHLREIIDRQDVQIAQQTVNVRELERIIASAIPLLGKSPETKVPVSTPTEESKTEHRYSRIFLFLVFLSSLSIALAGYLSYVMFFRS